MLLGVSYANNWDLWEQYHKVTFDGENKLIIISPSTFEIDVQVDLYSDWKEWVLLLDHMKFEAAMRAVGGDAVPGRPDPLGSTYFVTNGWQIFVNHDVVFTGNLYSDDFVSPFTVPDSVNIVETTVSNLVDRVGGWYDDERKEIRKILGITGDKAVPGGDGTVQDIEVHVAAIDSRLPAAPATEASVQNIDTQVAAIDSRLPADPASESSVLSRATDAGAASAVWSHASAIRLLGHQGENVRDDVLARDGNGDVTQARRRIFPDAVTAAASTAGGSAEGEIATFVVSATYAAKATWESLLRTDA